MRMELKNFDELIGMTNFDYAMQNASSLDIANTSFREWIIDGKQPQGRIAAVMSTKDLIINKLNDAFLPESLEVVG